MSDLMFDPEKRLTLMLAALAKDPADMDIPRDQVIRRLCAVCSLVMREQFRCRIPADCFCGDGMLDPIRGYQFNEQILQFIEAAVASAIETLK